MRQKSWILSFNHFFKIAGFFIPLFYIHSQQILSWAECVDLASKKNSDVKSASETLQSTEAKESGSYNNFYPQIYATAEADRSKSETVFNSRVDHSYIGALTATQNLFSGFKDYASTKEAEANTKINQAKLQAAKAQISFDLKTNYEGMVYANEYTKLTQDILKRRDENMKIVTYRFTSGLENKGSVLLSESYYKQAKYEDLLANNLRNSSRIILSATLGVSQELSFDIKEPVPLDSNPNFPINIKSIAEATPNHVQAKAQQDFAQSDVTLQRSGFYPSLDLTGSVGKAGPDIFPDNDRWSLGLKLTIPLFSGFRDYYNTKSSGFLAYAATDALLSVDQKLIGQLRSAYDNYVQAIAKLEVDESFRKAAEMRAEIARSKYNDGLLTFDEWDIVETDLINREKNYLQSKKDRVTAEAGWEQAQGKGVIL